MGTLGHCEVLQHQPPGLVGTEGPLHTHQVQPRVSPVGAKLRGCRDESLLVTLLAAAELLSKVPVPVGSPTSPAAAACSLTALLTSVLGFFLDLPK